VYPGTQTLNPPPIDPCIQLIDVFVLFFFNLHNLRKQFITLNKRMNIKWNTVFIQPKPYMSNSKLKFNWVFNWKFYYSSFTWIQLSSLTLLPYTIIIDVGEGVGFVRLKDPHSTHSPHTHLHPRLNPSRSSGFSRNEESDKTLDVRIDRLCVKKQCKTYI